MLKNYILTSTRNLARNGLTTLINIVGLALGITCSLVIFVLLNFVTSYDTFNDNYDRIYRVLVSKEDVDKQIGAGVPSPLPDAIREEVSGIESLTYIAGLYTTVLIQTGGGKNKVKYFQETEGVAYAEPSYFEIFTVPLTEGSLQSFNQPRKVVISEKLSGKYFGNTDAIGRVLHINGEDNYEVIAVMENPPENSDFPFQMLISYATYRKEHLSYGWGSVSSDDQIYMTLSNGTSAAEINSQFPAIIKKNYDEEDAKVLSYFLQPLRELHSDNRVGNYSQRSFSDANFFSLLLVGIFLVITACVNFINLSTAVALQRSREIGIRKSLGSGKGQIMVQFLGETFFIVLAATLLSLGLSELLLIKLSTLLKVALHLRFSGSHMLFLGMLVVIITLLAGLYPAFIMSRYKPVEALKNIADFKRSGSSLLRKSLVTLQFFISQLLIVGTGIILLQMNYINELELGFDIEAVVNVPVPNSTTDKKRTLKAELTNVPGVQFASLNLSTPASGNISIMNYGVNEHPDDLLSSIKAVDEDYLKIYNIPLLAGKGLEGSDTVDRVVVNEKWLIQSGFTNPVDAVGAQVKLRGQTYPVAGVVKDFQSLSAREKLQPVMLISDIGFTRQISLKLNMNQAEGTLKQIGKKWSALYPEYTFSYEYVDQEMADFYESERNLGNVFLFFSITAIIIGCMGLFGLITFTANRKVKEIGVRKVLGATTFQIFSLFSWDIIKLILISFVFVVPLAWYIMDGWLENYTYHLPLNPLIFVAGLLLSILLALGTIGYRALKAANTNPAESLRTE